MSNPFSNSTVIQSGFVHLLCANIWDKPLGFHLWKAKAVPFSPWSLSVILHAIWLVRVTDESVHLWQNESPPIFFYWVVPVTKVSLSTPVATVTAPSQKVNVSVPFCPLVALASKLALRRCSGLLWRGTQTCLRRGILSNKSQRWAGWEARVKCLIKAHNHKKRLNLALQMNVQSPLHNGRWELTGGRTMTTFRSYFTFTWQLITTLWMPVLPQLTLIKHK